jgi:peptide/nickel transport system substrate-binding protein
MTPEEIQRNDSFGNPLPILGRHEISRRRMLGYGAAGVAAVGAASLLAACGGSGGGGSTTASGNPVRGGTLKVGTITSGSTETVDPGLAVSNVDLLRVYQIFDFLFQPGDDIKTLVPRLALSAEPNANATVWTIKLRPSVTWHDGKPFTADDVVWSIKTWSTSANFAYAYASMFIDFNNVRKVDDLTVQIALTRPAAQFPSMFTLWNLAIVQNGATPDAIASKPIGTGPFKFVSFTPGQQSVFAANPNYWEQGKPYVDTLIVNSTFGDETSRYNALLAGQIDVAPLFSPTYAKQQASLKQINLLNSPGQQAYIFSMRVDSGPFADVRVRQAMKLLIDRQALIAGTFTDYAQVGNDNLAPFTQYFADDLKATYDPDKAKALLKAAGQENLQLTLPTADAAPGYVQSATLLSQQAKKAGVQIDVQQTSPNTYFTDSGGYLTRFFGQDASQTYQTLTVAAATYWLKGAAYDETWWSKQADGGNQALLSQAIAELDPTKAAQLWHDVQSQQFTDGGEIVWCFANWLDGVSPKVHGLTAGKASPLNNWRLLDGWIS